MKEVNTKKVLKFMYLESFKNKKLWISISMIPLSSLFIGSVLPYIVSHLLAELSRNGAEANWQTSMFMFGVFAIAGTITNRIGFLNLLTSQATTLDRIQKDMMKRLLEKSSDFYANRMTGKIVADGISLASAFIRFQDLIAINTLPFLTNILAGIVIVAINSPALAGGLLVMTIVVILGAFRSSRKRKPLREARHETQRNLHGYFADVIGNNLNVKTFAQETEELKQNANLSEILTQKRLSDWKATSYNGNNRISAILIMQALFMILVVLMVKQDPSVLAAGIFSFIFSINLTNKMFEISGIIMNLESSVIDASPMVEIMEDKPTILDKVEARDLITKDGAIDFNNVVFRYPENQGRKALFNDLSLSIKPGEKIGLVGHSGGGKTTITKLILRMSDLQGGEILIDKQNIAEVTQQSLRKSIAYVSQEPLLFHRTIAENISYGRPEATRKEIIQAAKLAHADDFIKDLKYGYDTLVGERGVKLSGGQRQRVAIARAMIKDAPILVLDEATSALDSESEVLIQRALWKLMEGRTAIVIAHRLSTIQKMDRIIVLDNGKITEQGSHHELLKLKGTYAELWAHQSGGFIEE